jgi:hypothetical protein
VIAHDPARLAAEMLVAERSAIAHGVGGEIDHCILFTRIAVDVCRERGIRAKALPVFVAIAADAEPDTVILLGVEGQRPENAPEDFWDGHLVAILDRRLMLDLSIDSIARPELGVEPEPFVAEVLPEFVSGGTVDLLVRGGKARYTAQPERKDYRDLPAWEQATQSEIARLADALLWASQPRSVAPSLGILGGATA